MAIEERLARLEAIEEIRALKARYCDACDRQHAPDLIAGLFAADGIWETADLGTHQGRDAIRRAMVGIGGRVRRSQHNATNLDLRLDADQAWGSWHFSGMLEPDDGPARLTLARYDEEYRREDGRWYIQRLTATILARFALTPLTD
ncbi:MAG: nuclear transport factor 2 family protein [Nocardioides sp.]|uniref:nuclear transport factor 2 family protein n=1 Tax=Nocardioides sp. TaxID=35761 RepID=UPI0039E59B12